MVNLYNLEWELLKKSNITDRAPASIVDAPNAETFVKYPNKYNEDI